MSLQQQRCSIVALADWACDLTVHVIQAASGPG